MRTPLRLAVARPLCDSYDAAGSARWHAATVRAESAEIAAQAGRRGPVSDGVVG